MQKGFVNLAAQDIYVGSGKQPLEFEQKGGGNYHIPDAIETENKYRLDSILLKWGVTRQFPSDHSPQ